jgi:dihydrolipoamide dehydrogenase
MTDDKDVVVIGGGPGGYPAALRAAQLGRKVTLIEKDRVGGECLNRGCIPSKALLSATKFYDRIRRKAPIMGISTGEVRMNLHKMQEWRTGVQETLVSGVARLLTANGVEVIEGVARFVAPLELVVTSNDGSDTNLSAHNVIIATGAVYEPPSGISFDGKKIMNPYHALSLEKPPEEVVIAGVSAVGIELATLMRRLQAQVTLIGSEPNLLSSLDKRVASLVRRGLKEAGIEFLPGVDVEDASETPEGKVKLITGSQGSESSELFVDGVVFAEGKRANTAELNLYKIGVEVDATGSVIVDDRLRTSIDHHYAVGDCTGPPFLAHRATKQGIIAAEVIAGRKSRYDFRAMPHVIFSEPEVAFVGMSEEEAIAAGYEIVAGQAPFSASGRALTEEEASGMVRIIADSKTGAILGAQLVGPEVTDLISQMSLALELGSLLEDISYTSFPHPTLPEMIMEAAASAQGKAINVSNLRRRDSE